MFCFTFTALFVFCDTSLIAPTPPPPGLAPRFPLADHQSNLPFTAGERVLASGSVQQPRFTLLESGSLLISPSHLSDAGTYTCMASNSRGIDEASADLVVWGKFKRKNRKKLGNLLTCKGRAHSYKFLKVALTSFL